MNVHVSKTVQVRKKTRERDSETGKKKQDKTR